MIGAGYDLYPGRGFFRRRRGTGRGVYRRLFFDNDDFFPLRFRALGAGFRVGGVFGAVFGAFNQP
jgi:hypothetical protein